MSERRKKKSSFTFYIALTIFVIIVVMLFIYDYFYGDSTIVDKMSTMMDNKSPSIGLNDLKNVANNLIPVGSKPKSNIIEVPPIPVY